uniref:Uncharacterized protein n=1 Tax=Fagus sylvatica TaxID=28930 RepID=A0A2N9I8M4_FAGSY
MSNTGSWRTSTSEREMVARARAHRFSSGPDLGWLRSQGGFDRGLSGPDLGWLRSRVVGSRSGVASIAGRRVQIWGGFDRGAASITGRLRSGEGSRVPPRRPQPRAHRPH